METFATIILVSVLIEAIVNLLKQIQEKETSWKYWASIILSIVISVLVTFNWEIDVFTILGFSDGRFPYAGSILTGLILSRGSNVVSDLIGILNPGQPLNT